MRERRQAYDFICPCKYMYDCIDRGILKSKVYHISRIFRLIFGSVTGYIYTGYLIFNIPTKRHLRRNAFISYAFNTLPHVL